MHREKRGELQAERLGAVVRLPLLGVENIVPSETTDYPVMAARLNDPSPMMLTLNSRH